MIDDLEDQVRGSLQALALSKVPDNRPVPPAKQARQLRPHRSLWVLPALVAAVVLAISTTVVLVHHSVVPVAAMPTMTNGCIDGWSGSASVPPVSNTWFSAANTMLPSEEPTSGTICIYTDPIPDIPGDPYPTGVLQQPPVKLAKTKSLSTANSILLAHTINAINPLAETSSSCPPGQPAFTIIALHYPKDQTAVLLYQSSGCQSISNGQSTRYETANASFFNAFASVATRLGLW